jgi:regulatory protein
LALKPEEDSARRDRPAPRRIDAAYLRRAALHYLERYSVPAAQLQRVLLRKVERSCRHHGLQPQAFRATVEEIVASFVASGLIDDRRFAEARAQSLRRKGRSARAVAAGLASKGVGRQLVAETVLVDEAAELEAARIAARRKRLGPWSRGDRVAERQKHIATLARAGFSLAIARAVIDDADDEA